MKTHNIDHVKTCAIGSGLEVRVVPMFSDNYGYIVIDKATRAAAVIDPADHTAVLAALAQPSMVDVDLQQIWVTHKHDDHSGGNIAVAEAYAQKGAALSVYGPALEVMLPGKPAQPAGWSVQKEAITTACDEGTTFSLGQSSVRVMHVPCHTRGHIAYYIEAPGDDDSSSSSSGDRVLACGDTLFHGGCGRFFEGSAAEMVSNMQRLAALPDDTVCLPAHEYTLGNFSFNSTVDTGSDMAAKLENIRRLREEGEFTVPTTIKEEKLYNLFMKTGEEQVQRQTAAASGEEGCVGDAERTMAVLRSMKDKF